MPDWTHFGNSRTPCRYPLTGHHTDATCRCNLRPSSVPHLLLAQGMSYIRPHAKTRSLEPMASDVATAAGCKENDLVFSYPRQWHRHMLTFDLLVVRPLGGPLQIAGQETTFSQYCTRAALPSVRAPHDFELQSCLSRLVPPEVIERKTLPSSLLCG